MTSLDQVIIIADLAGRWANRRGGTVPRLSPCGMFGAPGAVGAA